MRGGKAYSLVKFDKKPISAPVITEPDVVVAMNQPSLDFAKSLKDDGVLIINSDIIDEGVTAETKARVIRIPVTSLAIEATKRAQPANVVAVGAVIKAIGIIDKDQSISAMKEYFEEQGKAMFNESNEAAFMAGYNYVQ
ncbi:MAG: 2-oxoacid:acceptor oxidoreductase family protein [bacterium]